MSRWRLVDRDDPDGLAAFKRLFKQYDGRNWEITPVQAWMPSTVALRQSHQGFILAGCVIDADYVYHGTAFVCAPPSQMQAILLTSEMVFLAMKQCLDGSYGTDTLRVRPHYSTLLADGLRKQRAANLKGLTSLQALKHHDAADRISLDRILTVHTAPPPK